MGLDMYLIKKRFMWKDDRGKLKITGIEGINTDKVQYIEEEVAYWRKANQIHHWFADNLNNGEDVMDNCRSVYVEKAHIEDLLDTITKVLDKAPRTTTAKKLLPVCEGFFFGNTGYDDWYWTQLKETKVTLTEILENWDDQSDYHYMASW